MSFYGPVATLCPPSLSSFHSVTLLSVNKSKKKKNLKKTSNETKCNSLLLIKRGFNSTDLMQMHNSTNKLGQSRHSWCPLSSFFFKCPTASDSLHQRIELAQVSSCDPILELQSHDNRRLYTKRNGDGRTPITVQRWCLGSDVNVLLDLSPPVHLLMVCDL